ncbi:Fungal specific transcription factor domain-containing protein [Cladophialophora immunda]|nr:Fungal specific transcription factor domain-containing protein [Cladophialophora immunda]
MTLRLSSLDPNEPRAPKGYGLRIRWRQTLSSGGQILTGKQPARRGPSTSRSEAQEKGSPQDDFSRLPLVEAHDHPVNATYDTTLACNPPTDFRIEANEHPNHGETGITDISASDIATYTRIASVRHLLDHYDKDIASSMPWVDGPDNEWRNVMLSLALKSPSVLLAILALAAQHYSVQTGVAWSNEEGMTSERYRDRSLRLLSQNIKNEFAEHGVAVCRASAAAILATILILCKLEQVQSGSELWRIHWKAAQTIVKRWTSPGCTTAPKDRTSRFLMKEVFVYDVFASSTNFEDDAEHPDYALHDSDYGFFLSWLHLILQITQAERRHYSHSRDGGQGSCLHDVGLIRDRFKHAREQSLTHSKRLPPMARDMMDDLTALIDVYHSVGLVYAFQAFPDGCHTTSTRLALTESAAEMIRRIVNCRAFQHDLLWPLFILGTESREQLHLQSFVEARLLEVMGATGFGNGYAALEFLRKFWQTEPSSVPNWMRFARLQSQRGFRFLVI